MDQHRKTTIHSHTHIGTARYSNPSMSFDCGMPRAHTNPGPCDCEAVLFTTALTREPKLLSVLLFCFIYYLQDDTKSSKLCEKSFKNKQMQMYHVTWSHGRKYPYVNNHMQRFSSCGTKSQQLLPQGPLYCEGKTLKQYKGNPNYHMTPISKRT